MGTRKLQRMQGLGLINKAFNGRDNLATPTEAGPIQGSAVADDSSSKLTPTVFAVQGASIETHATAAGMPHVSPDTRGGLGMAWRTSETSPVGEWMGFVEPGVLHKSDVLTQWDDADVFSGQDATTIKSTQLVIAVYYRQNQLSDLFARTLDPADWTWRAEVGIRTTGAPLVVDACCCTLQDVDETVVVMENRAGAQNPAGWWVHQTIDGGAVWTDRSKRPFDVITNRLDTSTATASALSRIESSGEGVLFVRTGTGYAVQYASIDGASTFAQVGSDWTTNPPTKQVLLRLRGGFFGMVSLVAGVVEWRRVGSAFSQLENAIPTTILGATCDALAAWPTPDGNVYAAITQNGQIRLFSSIDNGTTWVESGTRAPTLAGPYNSGDTSTKYLPTAAAMSSGRAVLLGNTVDGGGGTTYDGMVTATQLGGWTNVETLGWYNATTGDGWNWLPYELPDTMAQWTPAGAGVAVLQDPGKMNISTAGKLWSDLAVGLFEEMLFLIEIDVNSGGSASSSHIGVRVRVGNGSDRTFIGIHFTTTSYAVHDIQAGVGRGTVSHGLAGQRLQVLVYHSGPTGQGVSTWYRAATSDTWILGHDDVTAASAASPLSSQILWGHIISTAADSDWYQFHISPGLTPGDLNPRTGTANLRGKALSAVPYPLLTAVADDGLASFLAVTSGPAIVGETHQIEVQHQFPKENMFVDVSPFSGDQWHSVGTGEAVVAVWSISNGFLSTLGNSTLALYMKAINFRQAELEGSTDGGVTYPHAIGTFDARIGTIPFVYVGDNAVQINPASNGNYARYVAHQELVGGTAVLFGPSTYRRVDRNTEGVFDADNTTRQALLFLDGIDGTEPASSSMDVWAPEGVLIVHNVSAAYTHIRVRVLSQDTADGEHQCGRLCLMSVHPFGKQVALGFSKTQRPNVTTRRLANGTTLTRENGPPIDSMVIGFQHGADRVRQREADPSPDYFSADTDDDPAPLATVDDVFEQLRGVVQYTEGGAWPVLLLMGIPEDSDAEAGIMITDPSLFHFGRINSPLSWDHIVGDEGVDEFGRTGNLTFDGLP
jgi:hypothetical protein